MMSFATSTGTRRNLAALREAGWGLLVTPDRPEPRGFDLLAVDNGAWGCFQRKEQWTPERWQRLVEQHGRIAQWVVAPDVVCGGMASLDLSVSWLPWVLERANRALIAVQDGMTADDLRDIVSDRVGVFVGGSTEWKEATIGMWGRLCTERGAWCHVGRVNSIRRIRICAASGVHSIDGTSATRFAVTIPKLDNARLTPCLRLYA